MTSKLMTELTPDVLKKLQETQIEILEEIVRICEKYNLRYFLIGGTLIGAIRHKGFIPWDDDLDIGMPRDDYEKFMQVAKQELNEKYYLQNPETEPRYWLSFAKVKKNNTIFEEPSLAKMSDEIHKGIFVDIFPYDYLQKSKGFLVHVQFIISKAINETMYYKAGVFTNKNDLRYKGLVTLFQVFPMPILSKLQEKVAKLQPQKGAKYLADMETANHYLSAIFPKECLLPVRKGEFEGKSFDIPNDYDLFLRMEYGDYMQLPKEEDRVNHRTLRIIFDTTKE